VKVTDEILKALEAWSEGRPFDRNKIGKALFLKGYRKKKSELPVAYVCPRKSESLISIYKRILEAWAIGYPYKISWPEWFAPFPQYRS